MPLVLVAPLALTVVLALLLVVRRRRAAATSADTVAAVVPSVPSVPLPELEPVDLALAESATVRLLRLQVDTLTEALREAAGEPAAWTSDVAEPFSVEREVCVDEDPSPVPAASPPPGRPALDATACHYADLSRALAATGRMREAALAQWAGDLRVLGPLLGERTPELYAGLGSLAPADVASAVTAARAVAAGLLGPGVPLIDLLPALDHLVAGAQPDPAAQAPDSLTPHVLPDAVVHAFESVLLVSAGTGRDERGLSIDLRCDLVAHLVAGRGPAEAGALVRDALEPHEQAAYDVRLAG